MYTRDLPSLLRLLNVSEQSGLLTLRLPETRRAGQETWHADLTLVNGAVVTCQIVREADGAWMLSGQDALRWLTSLGALSWQLEGTSTPSRPPARPPFSSASRPLSSPGQSPGDSTAQSGNMERTQRAGPPKWSVRGEREGARAIGVREHRLVFLLVDGRKTPEEIATLLNRTPGDIRQTLRALQAQQRIVWEEEG